MQINLNNQNQLKKKNTKKKNDELESTSSYDGKPVTNIKPNINNIIGDIADTKNDDISGDSTSKAGSYFSKNRKRRYPIFVDTLLKNSN